MFLLGSLKKSHTASRVEELYGIKPRPYERFYITGVEHEAKALAKNLDQFFQMLVEKIRNSRVSDPLRSSLARNLKPVRYYDQTVYVFEVDAQGDPSQYDGAYFERCGAQLNVVKPENLTPFIKRYVLGV